MTFVTWQTLLISLLLPVLAFWICYAALWLLDRHWWRE